MITGTDKEPDIEVHRTNSEDVLHAEASVPVEVKYGILPAYDAFTNLVALQTPSVRGFYEGFIT